MGKTAIVVGAGIIGICSAYALARRGWQITLIDGESGPAKGASYANGSQLSYCYTDALGSPATMVALPQLLGGSGGVSFGLSPSPSYLGWLLSFARNCTASRFRQNTLEVLALAKQSRVAMERLLKEHEFEFGLRNAGKIHLLYSDAEIHRAKETMQLKQRYGCEQTLVKRNRFAALDATLEGVDKGAIAALSTPSEQVGDAFLFSHKLLEILTCEYGMQSRFAAQVSNIKEVNGKALLDLHDGDHLQADCVIVAAGTGSNRLLARLGSRQWIEPMKGYSFEMPLSDGSPEISVTDSKRRLVFTNLGDRMRVAGIAELGNASRSIDPKRQEWMLKAAQECLPNGGNYSQAGNFWAGLRPVTPNSQPIIKRLSKAIAINTGHGSLGWTLAMGSGERLYQSLKN